MAQNWGKRSIVLDAKEGADRRLHRLAEQADVIVENELAGFWKSVGLDFVALREQRPSLIVSAR